MRAPLSPRPQGPAARPTATALDVLCDVFGYAAFRGERQEIIESVADGGHALVLVPTGGGKSPCYQIPALVRRGTGVVISPLIAVVQDLPLFSTVNGSVGRTDGPRCGPPADGAPHIRRSAILTLANGRTR